MTLGGSPERRGDAATLDARPAETGALVVRALRDAGPDATIWWTWGSGSAGPPSAEPDRGPSPGDTGTGRGAYERAAK